MITYTSDDLERFVTAQGITNPTMKLLCLIPLISSHKDEKIKIDDTYLQKIKNALNE